MALEMVNDVPAPQDNSADWRAYTDKLNEFLWNYQWYKFYTQMQYQAWITSMTCMPPQYMLPYHPQLSGSLPVFQQPVSVFQQQQPGVGGLVGGPGGIPTEVLANLIAQQLNAPRGGAGGAGQPLEGGAANAGNAQPNRQVIQLPGGNMTVQTQRFTGSVFKVPSATVRMLAEVVDTLVILLVKLVVTMFISDYFGIIDLDAVEKMIFEDFDFEGEELNKLIGDLIVWEMVHRLTSCLFEAVFLARNAGATPGKQLLGLRVVGYERVFKLGNGRVIVHNCTAPTFVQAILRSFVKNFSMAFLMPTPITALFHPFGLTIHDSVSRCVVVRDPLYAPPFEGGQVPAAIQVVAQ